MATTKNINAEKIQGTLTLATISATTYQNLPLDITITGGTYNSGTSTATFTNNTGGTFSVSGFSSGGGTFTGGTVTGPTIFTNGLTGSTISGGTFNTTGQYFQQNTYGTSYLGWLGSSQYNNFYFSTTDTSVDNWGSALINVNPEEGATLSVTNGNTNDAKSISMSNGAPNGFILSNYRDLDGETNSITITPDETISNKFVISNEGFKTIGGITGVTISATTYQNLPTDIRVTGGTYNSGTSIITFTNNTGGTFTVTGITATGGSFTGGTVSGATTFTGGLTSNVLSASTIFSTQSSGNEGGQIDLFKPQTNTTLSGNTVSIDVYQNKLRIFESGSPNRGGYIDLTTTTSGVGTNLVPSTYGLIIATSMGYQNLF